MAGARCSTRKRNIRLDASSIASSSTGGGARIILVDPEFTGVITGGTHPDEGSGRNRSSSTSMMLPSPAEKRIGEIEYEDASKGK